jgi:hypothetical protein
MLGIGLRDALASASSHGVRNAHPKNVRETHCIGEHLVYVGVHGYSLVTRPPLPAVPIAERLEGVVDEL